MRDLWENLPDLCDTIRSFDTFFSSTTNVWSIQWSPFSTDEDGSAGNETHDLFML